MMDQAVRQVFESYPDQIKKPLELVREAIYEVAFEQNIKLTEALKWGQPSYLAKQGSTIRLGWNPKIPNECAMYFHCQSSLVETFREIYRGVLKFEGNRAVLFSTAKDLPITEIKGCILMALRYHQIKHLPMLGA